MKIIISSSGDLFQMWSTRNQNLPKGCWKQQFGFAKI